MNLKRYEVLAHTDEHGNSLIEQTAHGDYVLYDEVVIVIDDLRRELDQFRQSNAALAYQLEIANSSRDHLRPILERLD
jgi:hypothetical protein